VRLTFAPTVKVFEDMLNIAVEKYFLPANNPGGHSSGQIYYWRVFLQGKKREN